MKMKLLVLAVVNAALAGSCFAQSGRWKAGIVTDEFIFKQAPFPSCHAATIAQTRHGLVVAWFGGTKERNPDVGIWMSRKQNGKWTLPVEIADGVLSAGVRYACWNPVLYQAPDGTLLLFYKVGPKPSAWKGWMKASEDGGITWSPAKALPEGFLGPIKNKPVLLKSDALLCGSSTEDHGWHVHFEITPDGGKTWRMAGTIPSDSFGAIQPTILFNQNGTLQALCRSKNRAILQSWSSDNGRSWTPFTKTSLPNNNSGIDGITLADGRQLLVYNHVLPPEGKAKGARTPLNVAVSKDGETWYAAIVLEDSPIGQYSYPSVIQTADGLVHIVYTWRRERIKHVVIDLSKLKLTKIENGRWPKS